MRSENGGTTCRPCIRHDGEIMDKSFVARRRWALENRWAGRWAARRIRLRSCRNSCRAALANPMVLPLKFGILVNYPTRSNSRNEKSIT